MDEIVNSKEVRVRRGLPLLRRIPLPLQNIFQ